MTDDILLDSTETDKRLKFARIVAGTLAVVGIFHILGYRNYLDGGHIPLTVFYFAAIFLIYRALIGAKIVLAIVLIVLAASSLFFSIGKTRWNKNYLDTLATPHAFILEDYIDQYPRLEHYVFANVLGEKDWVRLADECVLPLTRGRPVNASCRNAGAVSKRYRIDIQSEINQFLKRMQRTATDIKDGKIKSGSQYQQCIAQKRCAPIPLLPDNVDVKAIEGDSNQYANVRSAFWDLAENKGLTQPVCEAMVLCRAMLASGALSLSGATSQGGARR